MWNIFASINNINDLNVWENNTFLELINYSTYYLLRRIGTFSVVTCGEVEHIIMFLLFLQFEFVRIGTF